MSGHRGRALALATSVVLNGCASQTYWTDRGRDALDILTASMGGGPGGARLRAGPVHAGLIGSFGVTGLRGGSIQDGEWAFGEGEVEYLGWPLEHTEFRGKMRLPFSEESFSPKDGRGKGFGAISQMPFVTTGFVTHDCPHGAPLIPAYWTQLEAQAGVLWTLRVGLNLGEALDFLLGWAMLDLHVDDLGYLEAAERG